MKFLGAILAIALLVNFARAESPINNEALQKYVEAADESYGWKQRREGEINGAKFVELTLTSQTWRDVTWRHQLFIIVPQNLQTPVNSALLFITGGSWREDHSQPTTAGDMPREAAVFAALAEQIRSPVVVLLQVPFQPLFGDRYEDAIIAYTFDEFYRTGDETWPLLLPMVKSAARAMDAVQECAQEKWQFDIQQFTVTGASKRGWTTWLTGAVDSRAKAIAPMVIDMLNMAVQMDHQIATWGTYSEEIKDYTDRDLQARTKSKKGQLLQSIVDPFSYRQQLRQPKLIILGTNDRYWPLDALNNYWNDLQGPKHILYVPNNGHDLKDVGRLVGTLGAFHAHVMDGAEFPTLGWDFQKNEGENGRSATLLLTSDLTPQAVLAWVSTSPTKDFRQATWTSHKCTPSADGYSYQVAVPPDGYVAMFGEAVYAGRALPYYLSTNVRIFENK